MLLNVSVSSKALVLFDVDDVDARTEPPPIDEDDDDDAPLPPPLLLDATAVSLAAPVLVVNRSFIAFTYFVIGKTQLVPIFAKSGKAYCGKSTLVVSSIFGSNCVKPVFANV